MAVDITLKFSGPDLKGESKLKGYEGQIDVLSWSWGMTQTGTFHGGGGGGAGKVNVQDLSFTKYFDKSSATLMLKCSDGTHFEEAVMSIRKAGEKPLEYLKVTLNKVMITSVSEGGTGSDERLMENITLNFAKVKVEYFEQSEKGGKATGAVNYGWDVPGNAKW